MNKKNILTLLTTENIQELLKQADDIRSQYVGDAVHLRGLIEFSNVCFRDCLYCGIRCSNHQVKRYHMKTDEIFQTARVAYELGLKSLVLQSGEYDQQKQQMSLKKTQDFCLVLSRIKKEFDMAITLSMGELSYQQYQMLKEAGADRYLLRFETSSKELFKKLKPDSQYEDRLQCLSWLKELHFQVGSGIMVGLPGQTIEMIAEDILLMQSLDLDMVGFGPFIADPQTPLKNQSSATLDLVLRVLAVIRIVMKNVHIPATTAMGALDPQGRQKALQSGANVLMPNVTPQQYRTLYQLYPGKPGLHQAPSDTYQSLKTLVFSLGRSIAVDHGHSLKKV